MSTVVFVNYPPGACGNFIASILVHLHNPDYKFNIGKYGSCHDYSNEQLSQYFPSVYTTPFQLDSDDFIRSIAFDKAKPFSVIKTHNNNSNLIKLRFPNAKIININTNLSDIASITKNLFVKIFLEQWHLRDSHNYKFLTPAWSNLQNSLEIKATTPFELNKVEFFKILSNNMQVAYKHTNFVSTQEDDVTTIEYKDIFLGKLSVLEQLANIINVSSKPDSAVDYYNHYVKLLHDIDDLKFINGI
jgi:hypothetical protein